MVSNSLTPADVAYMMKRRRDSRENEKIFNGIFQKKTDKHSNLHNDQRVGLYRFGVRVHHQYRRRSCWKGLMRYDGNIE